MLFQIEQIVEHIHQRFGFAALAGGLELQHGQLHHFLHQALGNHVYAFGFSGRKPFQVARHFVLADLLQRVFELVDGGRNSHLARPVVEIHQSLGNDAAHVRHGGNAFLQGFVGAAPDLVNVIQHHARNVAHAAFHAARHGQVNEKPVRLDAPLPHGFLCDECFGRGNRTDDHIVAVHLRLRFRKGQHLHFQRSGQLFGFGVGAVGKRHVKLLFPGQVAAHVGSYFAQAHHQHFRVLQGGGQVFEQFGGGVGNRGGPVAEGGFLHHAFVGKENGVHEPVQKRPGHVQISRPLVGVFGLRGDLQVADHLRMQPQRYLKQAADGFGVRGEGLEERTVRANVHAFLDADQFYDGFGLVFGGGVVDFGAVAGREHQHFGNVQYFPALRQQVFAALLIQRNPFPDFNRGGLVRNADGLEMLVHSMALGILIVPQNYHRKIQSGNDCPVLRLARLI